MREIKSIADRLEDFTRELSVSGYTGFLEETNFKIKRIANAEELTVDIWKHSSSGGEVKKFIKQLENTDNLSGKNKIKLQFKDELSSGIKIFEEIFPSIAWVILDEEFCTTQTLKESFLQNAEQYKVIFIINSFDNEKAAENFSREAGYRIKSFIISLADVVAKSVEEILSMKLDNAQIESLKKVAYLNSVKPLFGFLSEIISSENKSANTRKQLNTQNTQINRKEEQGLNNNELASNVKQNIQKLVPELERSFRGKYDDLNKPNIGPFSIITKELTDQLPEFEKQELAEKSERVNITIPKSYQEDLVNTIIRSIKSEFQKDEAFIKSSFDELLKNINNQLKAKGIKPITPADVFPPFPEPSKITSSYCYISREFTGELMKKGAAEYFVALRDYTGVIMVAVGILGPLNGIVALESEFEKGSAFISFFKTFNKSIKGLTALITIGLISYGIYDLRRRIPKKRIEEMERERNKAKESLNTEGKRMFNESSRDWVSNISLWIKEVSTNIMNEFERNTKDLQVMKMTQMNAEKTQQQKQQQSIDLLLRSISSADKIRDTMYTRFRDLVTETEKELKF